MPTGTLYIGMHACLLVFESEIMFVCVLKILKISRNPTEARYL